jgi:hypothetical protein
VTDLHPAALACADQAEAAAEIHGRALARLWMVLQAAGVDDDLVALCLTNYQHGALLPCVWVDED